MYILAPTKRKSSSEDDEVEVLNPDKISKKDGRNSRTGKEFIQQSEAKLMRATERGELTPAEYHEQLIMLKHFETKGVDFSFAVTEGTLSQYPYAVESDKTINSFFKI